MTCWTVTPTGDPGWQSSQNSGDWEQASAETPAWDKSGCSGVEWAGKVSTTSVACSAIACYAIACVVAGALPSIPWDQSTCGSAPICEN
jgi:hypothetical protein